MSYIDLAYDPGLIIPTLSISKYGRAVFSVKSEFYFD